jgi:hypothetical protein
MCTPSSQCAQPRGQSLANCSLLDFFAMLLLLLLLLPGVSRQQAVERPA